MTQRLRTLALVLALLIFLLSAAVQAPFARADAGLGQPARSSRMPMPAAGGTVTYFPLIFKNAPSQAIIIDHTTIDITQIPPEWIAAARNLVVHYAHTSHGSQVLTGLQWLEGQNGTYDVHISVSNPVIDPATAGAMSFYDGNNYDGSAAGEPNTTYITPDLYWEYEDGRAHTRSVANTGWFDYSTWTWCGQMSDSGTDVALYLATLTQLEQQYPDMRLIYMTGHTDGSGPAGELYQNNNQVRQYVRDHAKVLFDFADIESYDPDGTYYPNTTDACPWCSTYCTANPAYCSNFAAMGDCAHTHKLLCKMKGQAWWWLMARLAGWPGPT